MDSVTHIVVGACAGEALLGKRIGRKAMLIGAAAQSIPDIDFVSSFWLSTTEDLLAHRGFTHSFLFAMLVCPVLGFILERKITPKVNIRKWIAFFLIEIFIHLFLDAFNNYGVGWFEPFSDIRISFHTIYVADPVFTIFPLIATLALLFLPEKSKNRRMWWRGALSASAVYLCICIFNKIYINNEVRNALNTRNIPLSRYFTTPAPLQNLLWMVVAGDKNGYHIGYRSVLDTSSQFNFRYFPVNEHLLDSIEDHEEIDQLKKFSQGFYTVEKWGDTLVFNDLRFGQIIGWHDPKEKFVFHYFLQHPEANVLIVQRGRFQKWDDQSIRSFWRRMWGK